MTGLTMNGIDYTAWEEVLRARGIDPDGTDEAFGPEVYCNQHLRVHSTGWCTVDNREKCPPGEQPASWPAAGPVAVLAGRYWDAEIRPGMAATGVPEEVLRSMRRRYIPGALANPEAVQQLRDWATAQEGGQE